ncbi:unnamed protein product, partial [Ixodes hexagonus]
ILRRDGALIRKIELTIDKGKQAEQNLTALRNIVHAELVKETREREKTVLTVRLNKIESLLNELHVRNSKSQREFRSFMHKVSVGEIRSESHAHRILEDLYTSYTLEVDAVLNRVENVLVDAVSFLKSVVRNASHLLGDLVRLKLGFLTGLFSPGRRRLSPFRFMG